ncbi:hypothetical protein [Flavicella sp.]|uniref:hypothetical protein n=1 Tax=Flavicella sp. TaxID=2957742 RepID=UPI002624D286|nr:hypothetical protein [Flavicella sp.]MDG1806004.1 hypothetical protein [Flavicella sp.]MDG2280414.1 hypothetical protein [Flavicella sp.]
MDTSKIIINNALKIFFGIVAYFFLMKVLGLENITELRLFNFLIVVWGVNSAIKQNLYRNHNNTYLTNLSIGFSTSFFAVLAVAFSLIFYITFIDFGLLGIMENSSVWGKNLSLGKVIFAILIEGLASSVICTFIIMQYWKKYKTNILA